MSDSELELREVGIADLDAIVALVNACDLADSGEVDLTRDDIASSLRTTGARAWALVDGAGAYHALVWIEPNSYRPAMSAEFFPDPAIDPSVAAPLIPVLLKAHEEDPDHRPLQIFVNSTATAKSTYLRSHGAKIVRHFFKMAIDLNGPVPGVSWSDDEALVPVADTDEDLAIIHAVTGEAFADHWQHATAPFDEWTKYHRDRDNHDTSLWWLVRVDGEPAAALIGANSEGEGFVATLGVLKPYRGRGLGQRLLQTSFAEFQRRGLPRATLYVDSENSTGAVRLYESVGMSVASQWDSHEFAGG